MVERNCVTRGQGLCLVSEKCPAISSYTCHKKDCCLDQRERESVSTWWTSLVSSCAAFLASLSKKSELAFGDGAILYIIIYRVVFINSKCCLHPHSEWLVWRDSLIKLVFGLTFQMGILRAGAELWEKTRARPGQSFSECEAHSSVPADKKYSSNGSNEGGTNRKIPLSEGETISLAENVSGHRVAVAGSDPMLPAISAPLVGWSDNFLSLVKKTWLLRIERGGIVAAARLAAALHFDPWCGAVIGLSLVRILVWMKIVARINLNSITTPLCKERESSVCVQQEWLQRSNVPNNSLQMLR